MNLINDDKLLPEVLLVPKEENYLFFFLLKRFTCLEFQRGREGDLPSAGSPSKNACTGQGRCLD